ncbi:hypothetical protein [Winogradskyella sp.]|uniref:hypothetical protein n=1 Tax=Winogradskyella sp. TaxID=1883156 RepID=UPI00262B4352|nr:hypothetical protein [Winogradskyella sp.]
MKRHVLLLLFSITVISCGPFLKVSELKKNGRFKASKVATTLKSVPFDLDTHKALLVVPQDESKFFIGMAKNISYFDRVITFENLEKEIEKAGNLDKISSLRGLDRWSKAYEIYQPFLILTNDFRDEDETYWQLKLINPANNEELFVNEIPYDFDKILWITDKNTYNPTYNGLIEYIESNSTTYNK